MKPDRKAFTRELAKLRHQAEALRPAAEAMDFQRELDRLVLAISDCQTDFRLTAA